MRTLLDWEPLDDAAFASDDLLTVAEEKAPTVSRQQQGDEARSHQPARTYGGLVIDGVESAT